MNEEKQCGHCYQKYDENEVKTCEFHLGGEETIVTTGGIKTQPKLDYQYCKNCAFKHDDCGKEPWI